MVHDVRPIRLLGPVLLALGAASLALGVSRGEASFYLVLIFPVITGTGAWAVLGILLLAAGFFLTILALPFRTFEEPVIVKAPPPPAPPEVPPQPASRSRWGGVVFLGPIPIVFGSDQRIAQWMLVAGVILFLALLVLTLLALRAI